MTATASNTTATRIDGTAAFFIVHLVSSVMYHADRDKRKCDLRWKATGIRRVGRPESTWDWTDRRDNRTSLKRIGSKPGHQSIFRRNIMTACWATLTRSRAFIVILKNSLVIHHFEANKEFRTVQILCDKFHARMILAVAEIFSPWSRTLRSKRRSDFPARYTNTP